MDEEKEAAMRLNTAEGIWDLIHKKVKNYNSEFLSMQEELKGD